VTFLAQFLELPHVMFWLPCIVFGAIVGGAYFMMRGPAPMVENKAEKVEAVEAAKSGEQRVAFRRQGNPVEVLVAELDKKDAPAVGSVLDRSLGGVRLTLYDEVPVGVIMAIRPANCDALVPWTEVEIRSCRPSVEMPGRFEIGCQYVKSPPYSIQLLFG
jgi:hypothetical protein